MKNHSIFVDGIVIFGEGLIGIATIVDAVLSSASRDAGSSACLFQLVKQPPFGA
jgi:hypothetical protein